MPVDVEGEDARTDDGVVQLVLREVNISCLPTDIPEAITVDVSGLAIGDVVTVAQLTAPKGVTILNDPEETVVTVTPARRWRRRRRRRSAMKADEAAADEE